MKNRLYSRISDAFKNNRHLKQKDLAERLCISPAAVNRLMHGRRYIRIEEIPIIEDYIGISLTPGNAASSSRAAVKSPEPSTPLIPAPIPVYRLDGTAFEPANAVDWIPRHPVQLGSQAAFAVYAETDEMAPRYFKGDIAYIHPRRPVLPGHDVLLVPEGGPAFLARLLHETEADVRLLLFKTGEERDIPKSALKALYAVVGRG